MELTAWTPSNGVDVLAKGPMSVGFLRPEWGRTAGSAPMDLIETEDSYLLTIELPGYPPDAIDIEIDAGVLAISAKRAASQQESGKVVVRERFSRDVQRRVKLPQGIDIDGIAARSEHGLLILTLPKNEQMRRRRIEVKTGAAEEK